MVLIMLIQKRVVSKIWGNPDRMLVKSDGGVGIGSNESMFRVCFGSSIRPSMVQIVVISPLIILILCFPMVIFRSSAKPKPNRICNC